MNLANTIDCRGLSCPEPVLRTARAAKALSLAVGGTLEVLADDDAFPMDIESWCRSANASLMKLEPVIGGGHRALIGIKSKLPPPPRPAASSSALTWKAAPLDCRGKACPEPVLALARFARTSPGGEVEIIADDAAFSADVEAWCRSAGASILSRVEEGRALRVRIQLGTKLARSSSSAGRVSSPLARTSQPAQPLALPRESEFEARFDLRRRQGTDVLAEVARIAMLGEGTTAELLVADQDLAQQACAPSSRRDTRSSSSIARVRAWRYALVRPT